jgi:sulfur relay (sulfurtransferase) DsrF/TusC family protein
MNPKRMIATLSCASLLNLFVTISSGYAATESPLTIDTPVLELLQDLASRQVLERNLPNLVKALEEDYDVADFLGISSLKELSIDDDHVVGFDDELLTTLRRELSAAQTE